MAGVWLQSLKKLLVAERVVIRDALYPTFYATYPFEPNTVEIIEKNYRSHILNARSKLDFSDHDFDRVIRPILHHTIRYFMALPASERHHHTDMSASLFFHSLQTANIALAKYHSTSVMPDHIKIEHKKEYSHAAGVAIFLAALFHDAGKLFSDMTVYQSDKKGQLIDINPWDPISESLYDFCTRRDVKYYRVKFDVNRKHNAHNAFTTRFVSTMPAFPDDYTCSSQILIILDGILFGTKEPHTAALTRIIKESDSQSVKMDFQRYSRPIQSDSLSVLTLDAIKNYIEYYPDIAPTDPRAVLIRSNLGVHIPYPGGIEELINFARGNNSKLADQLKQSIPDAQKLLTVLNESGYIQHHYFQTTARSPQIVRTIKFEHANRFHSLQVVTLRPSEIIALIPTRVVLEANYDDQLSAEYLNAAKNVMLDNQECSSHTQSEPANTTETTDTTDTVKNQQIENRPQEPAPVPLIKNTLSKESLEKMMTSKTEINIEFVEKPPSRATSERVAKPNQDFMIHIDPQYIESVDDNWRDKEAVKLLHETLSEINEYQKSTSKMQDFIQELCIAFSKGLVKFNGGTQYLYLTDGKLHLQADLLNYLSRNTVSGSNYKVQPLIDYNSEFPTINIVSSPDAGENERACAQCLYTIHREISKILLGPEYEELENG